MAYVNVAEWSPDQVSEWLKGLDEAILPYIHYFVNNQVDGKRLLQLSPDDLPPLRVTKIGHQEIVLQAVELLRNIHYQLHQENVQLLALRLSSKARSIYNELHQAAAASGNGGGSAGEEEDGEDDEEGAERRNAKKRQERVSTAVIAGVADVLSSVKGLVSWLTRQPFEGQEKYDCLKSDLVELSIRLATIAQRDMFAEKQATVILQLCLNLAIISDKIIQEYNDPLIIQPATLDIATIKKKADDEWGVFLQSSYHGVHQVSEVRALSPAYQCGKLQDGDELVQVNYQTVIGWSPHKVTAVMQEFPVEVILTVKKRPRHANTVAQIYLKPMRLPSKKRTSVPIRRVVETIELPPKSSTPPPQLTTPSPQPPSSLSDAPSTASDREIEDSDSEDDPFLSDSDIAGSSPTSVRLYHPKPRAPVQRRATIPGATTRPCLSFDQDVRWTRGGRSGLPDGSAPSDPDLLRGPTGLDHRAARPHTCIGTEDKVRVVREGKDRNMTEVKEEESNVKDGSKKRTMENADDKNGDKGTGDQERASDVGKTENKSEKKVVNIIPLPPRKPTNYGASTGNQNASPSLAHRPVVAEENMNGGRAGSAAVLAHAPSSKSSTVTPEKSANTSQESPQDASGRPRRVSEDRPKLDKSHSTPAYDMDGDGTLPGGIGSNSGGISSLLSGTSDRSPANLKTPNSAKHGSSSTNFFTSHETKTTLVSSGDVTPSISRSGVGRDAPATVPPTIISSTTTNVGTNAAEHFRSQVVFPVQGHTPSELAVNASGERHSSGGGNRRLGGSDGGGGINSSDGRVSTSSSGISGVESMNTQQVVLPSSACQPSTSSASAVVLRETRSSSPSVWRRGFMVTDRGDHQGWLHRRRDNKGFLLPHRWERRWFILKKNYLYGYRDREAVRADSLIYLPGWMSQMGLSAITSLTSNHRQHHNTHQQQPGEEVYYSETDEELEERSSPSRRSPQSTQSRTSPSKEAVGSIWRGGSASPSRSTQGRGTPLGSLAALSSGKSQGLRFLQPSRDMSTSTGDLRGVNKPETPAATPVGFDGGSGRRITRKNSLRDRLRQLPAPFTLERRRQAASRGTPNGQDQQKQNKKQQQEQVEVVEDVEPQKSQVRVVRTDSTVPPPDNTTSVDCQPADGAQDVLVGGQRQRPHYMLPTRASTQYSPARPSSVDLDTRSSPSRVGNGRWGGTPPPSGRCSPSKFEMGGRRSSVGGESPVRSLSPRRGSLDCLAWSHPRALSPPTSPLNTPTRSSHGSTSSLLASEEYREGSPEKLWINSLRTDSSRPRPNARSSPEKRDGRSRSGSGETSLPDRLKRTALYHPPQLRSRGDPMKAAFELALDPSSGQLIVDNGRDDARPSVAPPDASSQSSSHHCYMEQWEQGAATPAKKSQQTASTVTLAICRPEVPPRTKFLSPSERTLPTSSLSAALPTSSSSSTLSIGSSTSSLLSSHQSRSSVPSPSFGPPDSPGHNRTSKPIPNLTIRAHNEDSDTVRTPLKPAMGVSMIGKQRRTPSVMSPRDIFFSSPPSSPTTPNKPGVVSPVVSSTTSSISTTATYPIAPYPHNIMGKTSTPAKLRNQKILPHYPGMEYPPVFEPGSYSLCGSPPDQSLYQVPLAAHLQEQQGAALDSDGNTSCTSIETHVMFNVGQAGHGSPHMTNRASSSDLALQEIQNSGSDGGSCQEQGAPGRDYKTHRSIHVGSSVGPGAHHSVHVIMPVQSASQQNLYVTSMSGSGSHQNLYVSAPGPGTHQNIYVTSPVSTSYQNMHVTAHQNVYVSTPTRSSTQHNIYVTSPSGISTLQSMNVTSVLRPTVSEQQEVGGERAKSIHGLSSYAEGQSKETSGSRRPSSMSHPAPRLLLPGPPDSPPSDSESDLKSSSTQTESTA
ncbi:Connector enhancer of kinase suppressor of ras 2-like [Homarus americanus]|uniref:Connector enhancer of kinase suppressor of ras 2-like n=1 Tax=Homarus americanus TaxID=6706 RepID=A0A8J5JMC0_HOMAM|nr:Connector enhancer of kinase suppressor of ras 2-like [Homarus americanus]